MSAKGKAAAVAGAAAVVGFVAVVLSRLRFGIDSGGEKSLWGDGDGKPGQDEDENLPEGSGDEVKPVITVDSPKGSALPSRVTDSEREKVRRAADIARKAKRTGEMTEQEKREVQEATEILNRKAQDMGLPPLAPMPGRPTTVDQVVPPEKTYDTEGLPPNSGGPADLDAARREVVNVARHIYNAGGGYKRSKSNPRAWAQAAKGSYKRRVLADWQEKAGLNPDGLYGPKTRQRMLDLGAGDPPPPLFTLRRR